MGIKVSSQVTASEQSPERDFQPLSLLNNTPEVTVTPSKLATTADVEMSEHGTVVEAASQHKDKSPASGRELSSIPDIPNTKGTEPETSARLAVSEIPSEDRDQAVNAVEIMGVNLGDNTSSPMSDVSALIGNLKGKAATLQKLIQRGLLADRREERLCQPRDSNETPLTAPRPLAGNPEYQIMYDEYPFFFSLRLKSPCLFLREV